MGETLSTIIKFTTVGYEKATAALSNIGKAGGLVGKSFAVMATTLGSAGGALGKAASQAANFLFAIQNLGAIGGIIAGVQIVITKVSQSFIDAANKMVEAAQRAGDRIRERLARRIEKDMSDVSSVLASATTEAKRQAQALETMASAYLKVANAKDAAAKSGDDAAASGIALERSMKMASAETPEEKARIGSEYDVRIARQALADTQRQQDAAVAAATREADEKSRQAKRAGSDEKMARIALKKATSAYDLYAASGADKEVVGGFEAKKREAEAAYEDAISSRIAKQAESDAAEEALNAALSARTTAINNARKTLLEADAAERELNRAQKEAAAATIAKARAELEAVKAENRKAVIDRHREAVAGNDARAASAEARRSEYASTFAEHFNLWRDPAAAQQAQDDAKAKTVDLKRFQQAVNRYGGKGKIDEAAELMRQGDEAGLQDRLAQWRKSSRFNGQTEQMVLAAAAQQNEKSSERALANIDKNTAELSKKLDDLLKVK